MTSKGHLFLGFAILLSTLTHSLSASALPTNAELKIGITQEFENLNPLIGTMAATSYMGSLTNRSMIILTPDGKWMPQLAKSIPSLENKQARFVDANGKKGMLVNWEIIETAKWGDGTPITCKDIKFTWQAGLNSNVSVGSREAYQNIKSITWDESKPKKCVVTLEKAKWDFFREMPSPLPAILSKRSWTALARKKKATIKIRNSTRIRQTPVFTMALMSSQK